MLYDRCSIIEQGGILALPREQLFDWERFWLSEAPQFPLSAVSWTTRIRLSYSYESLHRVFLVISNDNWGWSKMVLIPRKIRRIRRKEFNAKCRHLKKLTCIETLRQMYICLSVWGSKPHNPPYTLYTCTQYTYSGKGGGGRVVEAERNLLKGNRSQSWVENTNMTDCISSSL